MALFNKIKQKAFGEFIDIIEWTDDPAELVSRAITPAKVQSASVHSADRTVDIVVADDQLALAIGKKGQNAKLAVRLTKWRINILSESERKIAVQESFERAFSQTDVEETDLEEDDTYFDDNEPDDDVAEQDDLDSEI